MLSLEFCVKRGGFVQEFQCPWVFKATNSHGTIFVIKTDDIHVDQPVLGLKL